MRLQIEYYFSVDNLVKDVFLRSKMDDNGWIAMSVRLQLPACMSEGAMPEDCRRICRLL